MAGILDEYPELADVAVVPLGVSRYNNEPRMRPHTARRGRARRRHRRVVAGRRSSSCWADRMVFAADEYYLLAGRPFPDRRRYGDFDMHEDGIGMARAFELEFSGATDGDAIGVQPGFFAWVDGAPGRGLPRPAMGDRRRSRAG